VKNDAGRARRFALHLPLRYRLLRAAEWREGRMENISRSGVLFWTDQLLDVDTEIEMSFMLPLVDTGSWIVCRGRIVRTVPPHEQQVPSALGAAFTSYRFVRGRNAAA
jgi:hypothetical protein